MGKFEPEKSEEAMAWFDESGYTLLHTAAYYNSWRIGEFLLKHFKE